MSASLDRHLTAFRVEYPDIRSDAMLPARKVKSSTAGPYASPAYLGRRGTPETLGDLAKHDSVVLRGKGDKSRWWSRRGRFRNASPCCATSWCRRRPTHPDGSSATIVKLVAEAAAE